MTRKKLIAIVAATAMAAVTQTAQASIDYGTSATLAQLAANTGNYLTIGDKTFSDFSFVDTGLTYFEASQITVTATQNPLSGVYNLDWIGIFYQGSGLGDLTLGYQVAATPPNAIYEIDQNYTGTAFAGGQIAITESVQTPSGLVPGGPINLNTTVTGEPNTVAAWGLNSSDPFITPPQPVLDVTKDIFLNAVAGQVDVSVIDQSFHQVPEPTTMIAGALLLLPFGASTLRILRKNRTA